MTKKNKSDESQDLVHRRELVLARTVQHAFWALAALSIAVIVFRPGLADTVWSSVTTLLEIGIGVLIGRHLDSAF